MRSLAERLGVSPATVAAAYKALQIRGLSAGGGRRGTTVSRTPPVGVRPPTVVPPGVRNHAHGNPDPALLPPFGPALRAIADHPPVLYGSELILPELARQARKDLEADGVPARALTVVSGGMDGIERALRARLRPGDRVVMEDPGFANVIDLLGALGLVAVPCAIDDYGLLPEALEEALAAGASAVIVTPRAQNPMGAGMDASRARALKRIVRAHGDVLVIEDDHGAGVAGVPLHPLCDGASGPWVFVRSLSKSLGPDLRLAILTGDPETVARIEGAQLMGIRWVSHVLQRLASTLWSQRTTAARLRKAETTYAKRRRALLEALASRGIAAHGRSGMNVWIPVAEEAPVVQALLQEGWAVAAGERFRLKTPPGIRVTISALAPADAEKLASAIAVAMGTRGVSASA